MFQLFRWDFRHKQWERAEIATRWGTFYGKIPKSRFPVSWRRRQMDSYAITQ